MDLAPPLPNQGSQHQPGTTSDLSKDMYPTTIPSSHSRPSDTVSPDHPSTASAENSRLASTAPTSTVDPDIPSSESAPTALPTNAATHPDEQKEALKNEHPHVVKREVEKVKAAEREVKGEKPEGTIVKGIEDDRLYAMLRRFDVVSAVLKAHYECPHNMAAFDSSRRLHSFEVLISLGCHPCTPPSYSLTAYRTRPANVPSASSSSPFRSSQNKPRKTYCCDRTFKYKRS